jgi:hypothetical protein
MKISEDVESQKKKEIKNSELVPDAGKIELGKMNNLTLLLLIIECHIIN